MSVHPRTLKSGAKRYEVRWREGKSNRSRLFDVRKDAENFDREMRRLRQAGELSTELTRRRVTVGDLYAEWLERTMPGLADHTVASYGTQLDLRILPEFAHRRAAQITVADIESWIGKMRANGDGDPTILVALAVLQSLLGIALRDGVVSVNVVSQARKPRQRRTRVPYLIKPDRVEVMRRYLLTAESERDVMLLDILAYAGLRPYSEAVALRWRDVRDRSMIVRDTKRKRERSVPMVEPLALSMAQWRMRRGRPPADALVVPSLADGLWTGDQWRAWRRGPFARAAKVAGLPRDARPRDLRGSFVSLLVHEGRSIVEVARINGHSPAVCLENYAQVWDEHDPAERKSAADIIMEARTAAEREFDADHSQEGTA